MIGEVNCAELIEILEKIVCRTSAQVKFVVNMKET